jgi:hypothetical protein
MSHFKICAVSSMACLLVAGCAANQTPIIAGAVDSVGLSLSGGVQDQGANLALGYKGAKFAIVPVQTQQGDILALDDGPQKEKGFSVFAMLGVDAKGGASTGAAVQQVLAVGPAAETWASRAPIITP